MDDEHTGQAVKIVVYRSDPSLTAEQLIRFCEHRLTPYKVPKHVQWTSEPLPKNPVGKVLRRLVREAAEREGAPSSA